MNRPTDVLRTLAEHRVAFIVVGGYAAVALGAPVVTMDLDVVHDTTPDNIRRLLPALTAIEARYRHRPELRPDASHLSSPGHQLLATRFGPLDCLGVIGNGHTYADLLAHTEEVEVTAGLHCRILDLETQIAVKKELGSEKDRLMLPILLRTLEERRRAQ